MHNMPTEAGSALTEALPAGVALPADSVPAELFPCWAASSPTGKVSEGAAAGAAAKEGVPPAAGNTAQVLPQAH